MVPAPGIRLPSSSADLPPQSSLVVAIDADEILVGDEHVATVAEAVAGDELEIAPLAARRMRGATVSTERTATVQGDREIEFRVLQRVMYTLNQNGYEHIALAVIQKS
jgi:biopolymer transport protein ExbD